MGDVTQMAFNIGTWLIPLTVAIVFHEVAHGRVAKLFGDMTASDAGRLSLNPLRHVDPFGTVILPMMLALSGAPVFGWAKPVPVVPSQLRNPRWHMVAVAAAGPLSNIILAVIVAVIIMTINPYVPLDEGGFGWQFGLANLSNFLMINLFLAVFNMLPIPPFDGSKVLAGILPPALGERFARLDRLALPILLIFLVAIPWLFPAANLVERLVIPPVSWLLVTIMSVVGMIFGQ
jgi:Zn-dependent protease